jgi:hypothetical protein
MQQQQPSQNDEQFITALSTPTTPAAWSLPRPTRVLGRYFCLRPSGILYRLELLDELQQPDLGTQHGCLQCRIAGFSAGGSRQEKSTSDASNILRTVLNLLNGEDRVHGMNTAPDTVTYNTVLAALWDRTRIDKKRQVLKTFLPL